MEWNRRRRRVSDSVKKQWQPLDLENVQGTVLEANQIEM